MASMHDLSSIFITASNSLETVCVHSLYMQFKFGHKDRNGSFLPWKVQSADAWAVLEVLFIFFLIVIMRGQSSQLQFKGGAAAIAVASSSMHCEG